MAIKCSGKVKKLSMAAVVVAGLAVILYGGGHYHIKNSGITLSPSRDYPAREVAYYLQFDPAWAQDLIGESLSSMAGAGCLISAVASSADALGFSVNPKELNRKLTEAGAYAGDRLIWNRLGQVVPGLDYSYRRLFYSGTIESDLKRGRLPIVNVKFFGDGVTHWVLIVGAKDGEFLIYDPANSGQEYLPLSRHGKVYAYRVLEKSR